MPRLHPADEKRARPRRTTGSEGRLPPGLSILVIAGLSALSWAVLIGLFMALRAIA